MQSQSLSFRVTILGSGTSTGVPVIGCDCEVCRSDEPGNKRSRASILITAPGGENLVVDTTPEFRLQMLRANIMHLEAVLYTHMHADHCHGFDDLRAFYFRRQKPVTCYGAPEHLDELKLRFAYAFEPTGYQGTKPHVDLVSLPARHWQLHGLEFEAIRLPHGDMQTTAYRIGRFAYATDFKSFSSAQIDQWRGKLDTMVASGIHFRTHASHSCIPETIELFEKLGIKRGIITHLSHEVDYLRDRARLPQHVEFARDGMTIDVPL